MGYDKSGNWVWETPKKRGVRDAKHTEIEAAANIVNAAHAELPIGHHDTPGAATLRREAGSLLVFGTTSFIWGTISVGRTDDGAVTVSHLAVRPKRQYEGVGHALLSHVVDAQREAGESRITATTWPGMDAAVRLLAAFGAEEHHVTEVPGLIVHNIDLMRPGSDT